MGRAASLADLETLVRLQRELSHAVVAAHDLAGHAFGSGVDWPRTGTVEVDGAAWTFQRHGVGYRFELPRGRACRTVVEFHDGFPERWDELDAWRVRCYLDSFPLLPPVTHAGRRDLLDGVQEWLAEELAAGRLLETRANRCRLRRIFSCAGDAEADDFCARIEQTMARRFGIPAPEARARIERHWRGQRLGGQDVAYHESEEYWANTIYFGPESGWQRGTDGRAPLPAP